MIDSIAETDLAAVQQLKAGLDAAGINARFDLEQLDSGDDFARKIRGNIRTGKTSLLQAGVFPRLRANGFCPVYIRLDHAGPRRRPRSRSRPCSFPKPPRSEGLKTIMPAMRANRMRLARMTGTQALQAAVKPGAALVTEDVACRIVEFVAGARGRSIQRLAELNVESALLSVVCRELGQFHPVYPAILSKFGQDDRMNRMGRAPDWVSVFEVRASTDCWPLRTAIAANPARSTSPDALCLGSRKRCPAHGGREVHGPGEIKSSFPRMPVWKWE